MGGEIEELVAKSLSDGPEQELEPFDPEQQAMLVASLESFAALESHEQVIRRFVPDPEPAEDRSRWIADFCRQRDAVRAWLRRRRGRD